VQYLAANGNFGFRVNLSPAGSIPAHGWYLVAANGYAGSPVRDDSLGTNNLSGTAGHALLAQKSTNVTGCADPAIVDKVGYGATASCPEGGSGHNTAQPTSLQTVTRKPGGCAGNGTDTDLNDADFGAPAASAFHDTTSAAATPAPTALNGGPICEGATLQLTASTIAGATYAWTGPEGFTSSLQNPAIANSTAAASGIYTVTVNGCSSATTTATVIAAGAACDDASLCTQSDTCGGGVCAGTPVLCDAIDQCHVAGTCDTATGLCSQPVAPNGAECSDGNLCTQTDTCQSGDCVGANPVTCAASGACHDAGVCDPLSGACSNPDSPDGTACDDANACTTGDACSSGTCAGMAGSTPGAVSPLSSEKSGVTATFRWDPTDTATTYDVLRGRVADWPVGSNPLTETCLADDVAGTSADDVAVPALGDAFWYLVRAENACGLGSYGSQGSHGVPTVPRSSATCP
jgi:hypothetical protein